MVRVSVNGYGTIGKRVADAVRLQPDMELVGIAKAHPDYESLIAIKKGIRVYAPSSNAKAFEAAGVQLSGTVEEMLAESDIVVDATPDGVGATYRPIYESAKRRAVFQGGEEASVADVSFSALCNYEEAVGKRYIRVVSCNTTGMLRILCALKSLRRIRRARVYIVRRAAEQREVKKGPINALVPNPASVPSHHAPDVQTVMKGLDIVTMAVVAPTTLMHVHMMNVELDGNVETKDVLSSLLSSPRIAIAGEKTGIGSTADIIEAARDIGSMRNDVHEAVVFEGAVKAVGSEVFLMYGVHQESIVVPENIDAIRASLGLMGGADSVKLTNSRLGIKGGYLI